MEKSIQILRKELFICKRMMNYYNHIVYDCGLKDNCLTDAINELRNWKSRYDQTDFLIYLLTEAL